MSSTFTPNYNLEIPGYDEQDETWGATMGADLTSIDAILKAISDAVAANAALSAPPGLLGMFASNFAPAGWIKANAGTIGSAASGATGRANADTLNLYTLWWGQFSALPIYTSSGVVTTRGASAAADFAANKRLSNIDMRDQFPRAWKDDAAGNSGDIVIAQAQDIQAHTHASASNTSASGRGDSATLRHFPGFGSSSGDYPTTSTGGVETRPKNIALLACWKL